MTDEFNNKNLSEIFFSITGEIGDNEEFRRYKEAAYRESHFESPNVKEEYQKLRSKITKRKQRLALYYGAATTVAASLIFFVVFAASPQKMTPQEQKKELHAEATSLEIVRSNSNAILQTSAGTIRLDEKMQGKTDTTKTGVLVAYKNNSLTYNNSDQNNVAESIVENHTLIVPRGGFYKTTLSDGSVVTLNSESQLKYPVKFTGNQRVVELVGEGYFSVAKDKSKPFLVKTRWATTEVVGTEFNVSSYENNNLNITLVEGSVKVKNTQVNGSKDVTLKPGENAELTANNECFSVTGVEVDRFTAWMNGYFYFDWERLEDILTKLKRWYDFDIQYQNDAVKDYLFRFRADRNVPFDVIFKRLEATKRVKLVVEGKLIYVNDVIR